MMAEQDSLEAQLRAAEARSRLAALDDDTLLSEDLAAVYLNITRKILANMRSAEGGPPFFKAAAKGAKAANQAVSYALGALRKWKAEHTYGNTLAANVALGLAFVSGEAPFFSDRKRIVGNAFDQRQSSWGNWMGLAISGEFGIEWLDPKTAGNASWADPLSRFDYVHLVGNTPELDPAAEFCLRVLLAAVDAERVMEWKRNKKNLPSGIGVIDWPDQNGVKRKAITIEATEGLLNSTSLREAIAILKPTVKWQDNLALVRTAHGSMPGPIIYAIAKAGVDPLAIIEYGIKKKRLPNGGAAHANMPDGLGPRTFMRLMIDSFVTAFHSSFATIYPNRLARLKNAIEFLSDSGNPHRFELDDSDIEELEYGIAQAIKKDDLDQFLERILDEEKKARAMAARKAIGASAQAGKAGGFAKPTSGRKGGGI